LAISINNYLYTHHLKKNNGKLQLQNFPFPSNDSQHLPLPSGPTLPSDHTLPSIPAPPPFAIPLPFLVPLTLTPTPSSTSQYVSMEIDSICHGPLSVDEQRYNQVNHLCMYCRGPSHIAASCLKALSKH
jgi:hypothetical protein